MTTIHILNSQPFNPLSEADADKRALQECLEKWCNDLSDYKPEIPRSNFRTDEELRRNRKNASEIILNCYETNKSLLDLNLSGVGSLPDCFDRLKSVERLHIQGCALISLPESLGKCKNLKELEASFNSLSSIPKFLIECTELTSMSFTYNASISLDDSLGEYKKLKRLSVNSCGLESLPNQFPPLLEHLSVDHNRLSSLPESLANCNHLKHLNAESCNLTTIPDLSRCPLESLSLAYNPLITPLPAWIIRLAGRVEITIPEAQPIGMRIPAYDIPKALGFVGDSPVVIGRGASVSAPTFGPRLTTLFGQLGASVMNLPMDSTNINDALLGKEIVAGINAIQAGTLEKRVSIPETLLRTAKADSAIGKIRDHAFAMLAKVDAFSIPGGPDIEPEFYSPNTTPDKNTDYRRSMTEFAFVYAADQTKKPLSGTCRGAQLLNVFFGGTLFNVEHRIEWQKMELVDGPHKEFFAKILQEPDAFAAFCGHHQACKEVAPIFDAIAHHKGVPKLIMSKDGQMIGTQFHLEQPHNKEYSIGIRLYEPWFQKIIERKQLAAQGNQ